MDKLEPEETTEPNENNNSLSCVMIKAFLDVEKWRSSAFSLEKNNENNLLYWQNTNKNLSRAC